MIVDLAQDASASMIETDVAIIGSGPAGSSLATRLKRDCCVIESGGPALDIKNHWRFWAVKRGEWTNADWPRVRGVGGASLRWTGRCIPLDPYDFEDRPWMADTTWPVSHEEISPWFNCAGDLMGLLGDETAKDFAAPEIEAAIARDERWKPSIWRFAANPERGVFRFGEHLAHAFEANNRSLYYHGHCSQIRANGSRIEALAIVTEDGREIEVRANHFVVAAGCIENARLLLDAQQSNAGLFESVTPWLGRGFNQHLRVDAGEIHVTPQQRQRLQNQINIFQEKGASVIERGFALDPDFARREKIGNASVGLRYAPKERSRVQKAIERLSGGLLRRTPSASDLRVLVEIDTEQTVSMQSHITLSERLDPLGRPRARVHWAISETDCRTAYVATHAFADFLEEQGLGKLEVARGIEPDRIAPDIRRDSHHHMGGTRMSEAPEKGVVDTNLSVHGVENLSVVGASVFTTGGHANPTQTIVALSLRLAEYLNAKT